MLTRSTILVLTILTACITTTQAHAGTCRFPSTKTPSLTERQSRRPLEAPLYEGNSERWIRKAIDERRAPLPLPLYPAPTTLPRLPFTSPSVMPL